MTSKRLLNTSIKVLYLPKTNFCSGYTPLATACHCNRGGRMLTNERTNKQTNKHDGSQYLLTDVIIRFAFLTRDTLLSIDF